jgi:succinate dehydrogenase / fumarate reductase cytochrome b subunit
MRRVITFYQSSVGKKIMMAVTGVILFAFVVAHLAGNLKLYQGADKFDAYAEFLREVGAPVFGHEQVLWLVRIVLVVAVLVHVLAAVQLTRTSWSARPVAYRRAYREPSAYASRTMRWGGIIIFAFVTYHLMHLTFGSAHPDFVAGSAYHNVVVGFQSAWVVVAYVLTMVFLGLHLFHGLWSALQTVGANHPRYNWWRRAVAAGVAVVITVGNISIPVSVLTGVVQ